MFLQSPHPGQNSPLRPERDKGWPGGGRCGGLGRSFSGRGKKETSLESPGNN